MVKVTASSGPARARRTAVETGFPKAPPGSPGGAFHAHRLRWDDERQPRRNRRQARICATDPCLRLSRFTPLRLAPLHPTVQNWKQQMQEGTREQVRRALETVDVLSSTPTVVGASCFSMKRPSNLTLQHHASLLNAGNFR